MENYGNIRGWSFPIAVDTQTGAIETTNVKEDIRQSIQILLSTVKGERLLHPEYGCNLNRFMFEPISYRLLKAIKEEVLTAIIQWEKRVYNVEVNILNDKNDESRLMIHIVYMIPQLKEVDEFQYFYSLTDASR